MATIVSISSQVARGHVGNSSVMFALQRLGHQVWGLPTVLLSNHPRHPHFGGAQVKPSLLRPMLEALEMGGCLEDVDGVLTGYLPTPEHVRFAVDAVTLVRAARPDMVFLCDPVLGDDPQGLFIPQAAAETLRMELLPLADIATPNRFELEWLMARPVSDDNSAMVAAQAMPAKATLVTSIPCGGECLSNLYVEEGEVWRTEVRWQENVPHGTGDFMAGLFLAHCLSGASRSDALSLATAQIAAVLQEGEAGADPDIVGTQDTWTNVAPWPVTAGVVTA